MDPFSELVQSRIDAQNAALVEAAKQEELRQAKRNEPTQNRRFTTDPTEILGEESDLVLGFIDHMSQRGMPKSIDIDPVSSPYTRHPNYNKYSKTHGRFMRALLGIPTVPPNIEPCRAYLIGVFGPRRDTNPIREHGLPHKGRPQLAGHIVNEGEEFTNPALEATGYFQMLNTDQPVYICEDGKVRTEGALPFVTNGTSDSFTPGGIVDTRSRVDGSTYANPEAASYTVGYRHVYAIPLKNVLLMHAGLLEDGKPGA